MVFYFDKGLIRHKYPMSAEVLIISNRLSTVEKKKEIELRRFFDTSNTVTLLYHLEYSKLKKKNW